MTSRQVTIVNRLGLHARAAAKFVHLASRFDCAINVSLGAESVEAKSILGLLMLAAAQGSELEIRCDGADEEQAAEALESLIRDRFGEGG